MKRSTATRLSTFASDLMGEDARELFSPEPLTPTGDEDGEMAKDAPRHFGERKLSQEKRPTAYRAGEKRAHTSQICFPRGQEHNRIPSASNEDLISGDAPRKNCGNNEKPQSSVSVGKVLLAKRRISFKRQKSQPM